jgi:hypothetical protein
MKHWPVIFGNPEVTDFPIAVVKRGLWKVDPPGETPPIVHNPGVPIVPARQHHKGKTYLLYLRESDLFGQEFEERSGTLRGKPVLVVSPHRVRNALRPWTSPFEERNRKL